MTTPAPSSIRFVPLAFVLFWRSRFAAARHGLLYIGPFSLVGRLSGVALSWGCRVVCLAKTPLERADA
ncbi:MAG: hypothetical protein SVU24_06145 [Pseudomonadota bacterium]|jgi:hypothetical protein|nr:hypothetical protein [Pseudomonadota bacterium]